MKKFTVSVGIPAFNEGANIRPLIESILSQKGDHFSLKEIIVVSDMSTDNTISEIKKIKSNKIKVIQNKKRSGQAVGQNTIIDLFSGDILILFNADVLPTSQNFIQKLITPFKNSQIGLVSPRIIPLKASNYFEKVINYSIYLKEEVLINWNQGDNLYFCSGRCRAFSKAFAKQLNWKESLSEDAYSYLLCKEKGFAFRYMPTAQVAFKSPDSLADHIKQSSRFMIGNQIMEKYFGKKMVKKNYEIPTLLMITGILKSFIKHPILFMSYFLIYLRVKANPFNRNFINQTWEASKSSKALVVYE